tara:strand:+ start:127 stop:1428 length:1302 start_codon:yes stop_codon:yes gene_type:complete
MLRKFYSIGLTGGIASGKTAARKLLRDLYGVQVIDADKLGHTCYTSGHPCLTQVLDAFGRENLLTDGNLDRAKLGGIVFSDSSQLEKLNNIVWPHIRTALDTQLNTLRSNAEATSSSSSSTSTNETTTIVVVEAAVLLEASWEDLFDEVWVVYVDPDVACQRLMSRNNFSLIEAQKRQSSQISNQERLSKCNISISNNNDLNELSKKLRREYAKLKIRASGIALNADEMLTVVNVQNNQVIGSEKRSVVKASRDLCYRATYIFVRQIGSELLYVQRRSELKDYCPGEIDPCMGGCVGEGESYKDNAKRELKEELGVDSEVQHLFTFLYPGDDSTSPIWGDVWETEIDIEIHDLQLQPEEVDEVFLMSPEDIIVLDDERNESSPASKRVTKDSAIALRMYLEQRKIGGGGGGGGGKNNNKDKDNNDRLKKRSKC